MIVIFWQPRNHFKMNMRRAHPAFSILLFLIIGIFNSTAQTITIDSLVPPSPYCAGDTVTIYFSTDTSGTFNARLSDSTGAFGGTFMASNTTSPIVAIIPDTIPSGTGYLIRVRLSSATPDILDIFNTSLTINTAVAPSITISSVVPNDTICAGTNVTFTATPSNRGTAPGYQWKKNGNQVGTNTTSYSDSSLANGDTITCTLTRGDNCASPASITSSSITMTVIPTVEPTISITASPNGTICSGTAVTFTSITTNGGTSPTYQWKKNGGNVGTGSSYNNSSLADGDSITCVFTSSAACASPNPVTSAPIIMDVTTTVTPDVTIGASPNGTICSGSNVTFLAVSANGGTAPAYQWMKNGNEVGMDSNSYSDSGLINGDRLSCVLTSNAACATQATAYSDTLVISVNPLPSSSFELPSFGICENSMGVIFSANTVTPGVTYSWSSQPDSLFDTVLTEHSDSTSATLNFVTDSDTVIVTLTATDTATTCSNSYSETIAIGYSVIHDNVRIEQLGSRTLVCIYSDAAAYQWGYDSLDGNGVLKTSQPLVADTFQSFIPDDGILHGDRYYWVIVTFDNGCITRVYFNKPPVGLNESLPGYYVSVHPNPSDGRFTVSLVGFSGKKIDMRITDITGKIISHIKRQAANNHEELTIGEYGWSPGLYILAVHSNGEVAKSFKLAIAK